MDFLYNAWYVAAWDEDIGRELVCRRLLDIPVLLYRTEQGQVVALQDRCPHRFAPLHKGRRRNDDIECGYHGLRFGPNGACTLNPFAGKIPRAARVRSFPIVVKDTIAWIWMGSAELADPAKIIDCSFIGDMVRWRTVKGQTHIKANYAIVIDNLLDLTHSQFLHTDSFGSDALLTANYKVSGSGETVHSNRWYDSGPSLPLLESFVPTDGKPVQHWVNMRWDAPSSLTLDLGMTIAGRPREEGWLAMSPNLLTPETSSSTHYFFSYSRNMYLDSAEVDRLLLAALEKAFATEDAPMVEAIQLETRDDEGVTPILLPGDAGAIRVRRVLADLISKERLLATGSAPEVSTVV